MNYERMTDEDRVLWSESIPGHLWNAIQRFCQCGAEVGVRCDPETVEQHLARFDPYATPAEPTQAPADERKP